MRNKFFKRAMALAMSLCMVLSMGSIASADETVTESKINLDLNVARGEQVLIAEVAVAENSVPFQELQIKLNYDPAQLEFKSVKAGGTKLDLTVNNAPNDMKCLNIIGSKSEPVSVADVVYTATFTVKEGAPADATVTVGKEWCAADANALINFKENPVAQCKDMSGTVASDKISEEDASEATVALFKGAEDEPSYRVNTAAQDYAIQDVAPGSYTMMVSKEHHAPRAYEVQVSTAPVMQDVQIHLLGDATQDGEIDLKDMNAIYRHAGLETSLTGYAMACGDIDQDQSVDLKDFNIVYRHVSGETPMW